MSSQQSGASVASEQAGASTDEARQMEASQPRKAPRPAVAAFGTSSGAAVIFRDYASI